MGTKQLLMAGVLAAGSIVGVLPSGPVSANTFTVTNTNAAGAGSLAQAVTDANANAGPDTITFDPAVTGMIDIGGSTLMSNDALTITGPGSGVLAITNSGATPIIDASVGAFEVTGLTFGGGDNVGLNVTAPGADVTITDVVVRDVEDIGIIVVNADAVTVTDVDISESHVGLQVDMVDSADVTNLSVSEASIAGLSINTVTGDVNLTGLDLTAVKGIVAQVLNVLGNVAIDDARLDDSNGSFSIDTASNATITNVDGSGLGLASFLSVTSVPGAVVLSNVDLSAALEAITLGTLDIDDLHVTVQPGVPIVMAGSSTGSVTISNSTFDATQFGSSFQLGDIGGSLDIDNSTISMQSQTIGAITGNATLTNVTSAAGFGMMSLSDVTGDLTFDTFTAAALNLSMVAGATKLIDASIGSTDGFPIPGLTTSDLDDLSLQRVSVTGGGASISDMKPGTTVDIDDTGFASQFSASLHVENSPTTDLTLDDSTVSGLIGGLSFDTLQSAVITNTTISGIAFDPFIVTDTPTEIVNSTISGNDAASGFALETNSDVTIHNSIIADNNDAEFDIVVPGSITAHSSILTPDLDTVIAGADNQRIDDPQLANLTDNGGLTRTMLPLIGSPAIDAGDDALAGTPPLDQRGISRPAGQLDIGSVEVENGTISITDLTVSETDGVAQVTLDRSGLGDAVAMVDVTTVDGTATAGSDYTQTSITVTWPSGDASPKTVDVPILTDSLLEGDETFTLSVSNPTTSNASSLLSVAVPTATVTIDDVPPGPAITSLAPARFVDTRSATTTVDGRYQGVGKRGADTELEVIIAGRGGVPADARGVVMNITAIGAEGVGFVTAHSCVSPRPNASSLNVTAGVNLGNEVVAGLSSDGSICLYTSGSAHLTVDVVGYVAVDSPTSPVTPARILDTRAAGETIDGAAEGDGKTTAGGQITLEVAGRGGVPAGAEAVILNVTAIGATSNGFATVHPCVSPAPTASSLNFVAGVNRGNELVVSLNASGQTCLLTSASIHLTADVVGYIPAGTNFSPVDPGRLLDTRPGQTTVDGEHAGVGRLAAGDEYELMVAGRGGVPVGADAAVVNLTAVGASGNGFITMHPCVDPRPNASSLNYVAGVNGGNEVVAQLDASGKICIYTSAGTHVTVDVVGALITA